MVATERRILVVDDEEIVRASCQRVLTEAGYAVRTAASGRDALRACRDEPVDVMLTDLRMPDMDGIEVIRAVTREFPDVRVVVITGYPTQESAEQARRLGIFDYLEKPLSPARLNDATSAALARPPRPAASAGPIEAPGDAQLRKLAEAAAPSGDAARKTPNYTIRLTVMTAMGFLAGVSAAYAIAPTQGLAYLAVGTAIASGTILGLFSDALFGRSGGPQTP